MIRPTRCSRSIKLIEKGRNKNTLSFNTLATPVSETKRFKNEKWNQVDSGQRVHRWYLELGIFLHYCVCFPYTWQTNDSNLTDFKSKCSLEGITALGISTPLASRIHTIRRQIVKRWVRTPARVLQYRKGYWETMWNSYSEHSPQIWDLPPIYEY